jgi:hypothetical protein
MRYCDYLKETARLEKTIAESWQREVKALSGKGPWFVRLFPGLRGTAIDVAGRKRGAAALKRAKLQSEFFAPPSTLYNDAAVAALRPVVPGSEDDIAYLRDAAAAALNSQR